MPSEMHTQATICGPKSVSLEDSVGITVCLDIPKRLTQLPVSMLWLPQSLYVSEGKLNSSKHCK